MKSVWTLLPFLGLSACATYCDYENYSGPGDTDYDIHCANGDFACSCINPLPDANEVWQEDGGDESAPECGTVMLDPQTEAPIVIISHNSCDPLVQQALDLTGAVPFSLTEPICDEPMVKFRCFTELELIDDGVESNNLICAFCPELTGYTPVTIEGTFSLCWQDKDDWEPGTLGGAIPKEWDANGIPVCGDIEPNIGETVGYVLPMFCNEGFSCLDGGRKCSCNCRDTTTGIPTSIDLIDYISWWWNWYPNSVPPLLDEGTAYPVEPTCTGEPFVWVDNGNGVAYATGSTIELDGFEPAYPPNGEYNHVPSWELLPAEPYVLTSIPRDYVNSLMVYPSEMQWGGSRLELGVVTECHRGSICDRIGLRENDTISDYRYEENLVTILFVRDGTKRELPLRIDP